MKKIILIALMMLSINAYAGMGYHWIDVPGSGSKTVNRGYVAEACFSQRWSDILHREFSVSLLCYNLSASNFYYCNEEASGEYYPMLFDFCTSLLGLHIEKIWWLEIVRLLIESRNHLSYFLLIFANFSSCVILND